MGKLSIGVVSTEVYRTSLHPGPFHVFVRLRVDGKYIFTTKKRTDRRATFLETFVVGNTHRLALVEASVYHRSERGEELLLGSCVVSIKRLSRGVEKVREHVLVGVARSPSDDGSTASAREKMIGDTLMLSTIADDADSLSLGAWASTSVASLCATTPWGASETNKRSAFNGSPKTAGLQSRVSPAWNIGGDGNGTAVPHLHIDRNDDLVVAGKIVLSLFSDDLGDYGLSLNTKVEEAYTQRLRRLCFLYHRAVLDRVDLLIADVRENYEVPGGGGGGSGAASPSVISSNGSTSSAALSQTQKPTYVGSPTTTTGGRGNVTIRIPEASHPDTQHLPYFGRTFADVLERVTTELGPEKQPLMLTVTVEGANNLAIDVNAYPNFSQMNPFVVIRSDWEQLETTELLATSNPVYNPDTCTFHLEVLDPSTFRLDASVMTRVSSRGSDEVPIGHSAMTLQCLPIGLAFSRVLPLVKETNMVGILRLSLTAQHFGRSPEMVDEVSHRLRQLTRFLIRYEPAALPFVDAAVQKHELVWDAFMGGLIQKYGREPGTVQLGLCVNSFCSLVPPPPPPLSLDDTISVGGGGAVNHRHHHGGHNKRGGATRIGGGGGQQWPISAYVSIRMGDTHLRTAAKKYYGFEEVIVNDTFVMDVARETDELHIEVIEEGTESVVGRVDLTILGIQRGVTHTRSYTIVANAGTNAAACSGRLSFSMHCDQIGVEYEVDHESECMFAMRLTRFCERYIPEKLHRVDIAVATTEDMETFLGQLAFDHGPEPSYVRVSVTVEGLKHIGQRYLNSYTHVILECGVLERHETRIAKMGTQDPEFHETWVMDQPRRDLTLRLKLVASQASNMSERVLIATAAIPIIMDTTSEVRWVPLSYVFPDDVTSYKGTIGVGTFVQPLALSSMGGTEGNRSIMGMSIKGGGGNLHARHHLQQQQLQPSGGEAVEAIEDDHTLFMSPLRPSIATNVSFDISPMSPMRRGTLLPVSPGLAGTHANTTSPFSSSRSAYDWQLTTVFVEVHSVRDLPPFRPSAAVGSESDAKHSSKKKQDKSKKTSAASGGASSTSTVAADSTARVYFVARIIHVSASDVNNNNQSSGGGGGDALEGPVVDISNVDDDDIIFESSRVPLGDVDANACVWNTDSPSHFKCRVDLPSLAKLQAARAAQKQQAKEGQQRRRSSGDQSHPISGTVDQYYRATFPVLCLTFYCIPPSSTSHQSIPLTAGSISNTCSPVPSTSPIKHVMFSSDPQPKPKKIGDCFVSLAYVPTLPQQWNKHVPVINASGRTFARSLGTVHVAVSSTVATLSDSQQQLRLSSFAAAANSSSSESASGAATTAASSAGVVRPTEASEEKTRRDLTRYLQGRAPDQLHLVDVLVSEFLGREDDMWQRLEAAFGSSSSTAGSGVTSPSNQNTPSSPVPILLMPDVSTPDGAHHYHHSYSGGTGSSSGTAAHAAPPLAAHITLKHIQSLVVSDGRRSPLFEVSSIMLKIKTPREKIKTRPFSVSQNQFFLDEMITVRLVDPAASSSTFSSPPPALSAATTVSSPSPSVVVSVEDASDVPILDADPNEIHVEVYSCTTFGGKTLICETYISLNNTQRGVPRERSHVLMTPSTGLSRGKRGAKNGGDASSSGKSLFDGGDAEKSGGGGGTVAMRHHAAAPIPCGLLTVVISNDAASRNAAVSEQVERDVQLRFRSFFECYDPSQLSRLDLYVGAALQRNQTHTIMSRLKEAYGPEPGDNRLEVTMDRCRGTLQTDKNGGHSRPFVVLALGMSQFHTRSQYALTDDIAFHRETFTFHVGLPDQQELHVYLMDEGQPSLSIGGAPHQSPSSNKGKSPHLLEGTESGRVLVSLAHMGKRGVPCKRKLPLVFRAGTKDAVTYGTIELTLTSNSFSGQQHHHHHHAGYVASPQSSVGGGGGHRRVSSSFDNNGTTLGGDLDPAITTFEHYQERVLRLLSRYVPEALHRYDIIMGKYVNREEDMMRELVNELGAEPGTYPLYVRIIGFRGPHHFTKGTSTASAAPVATRLVLSDMQQRSEEDHNIHDGDALVIKLLNNGEEVLKTDTCKVDHGVANLSSAQHNDVRTELRDIQGSVLSFELYRRGFFGKKTFLAAADIGVRHLVRDFSNVRWMPLFRVEGDGGVTHHDTDSSGSSQQQQQQSSSSPVSSSSHHHQLSSFIGVIGVELKTQSFGLPSAKRDEEQMSDVGVDVMTLLRKYNPAGLRQLDLFLERTPSVSGAHALLRRTFNPAAASTLYIAIHSIQLELKPTPLGLAGRGGGSVNGGLGGLGTSTTGKKPAKSLHQNNGNVLSEPAVWKSGETSKRIVCMGLLAGEMVRCEGVCHRGGAAVTTIGGDNQQTAALNAFGAMRFDVVPTPSPSEAHGPKSSLNTVGPTLSLQIVETSKNGNITLGAVDISARAILSQPRALLFGTDEGPLTFPIVLVQQSTSAVDAYISGSVTLSVSRPAYEALPAYLMYSPDAWKHIEGAAGSDELFIVSYYRRILKMLQFYDPAALVTFHRTFFDQEVNSGAACKWRLPRLLETLKEQWGPEPRE